MPRIEEKVRSLLDEQDEIADELRVLLDETEDGEPVSWDELKDTDITTGTWGRLIQTGILTDGDDGFTIEDREAVEEALDENSVDIDFEPSGWQRRDKIAGLFGVFLVLSYSLPSIRDSIGSVIDILLGPLAAAVPFYVVIIALGVGTGFVSSIVRGEMVDEEMVSELKDRINELKEEQENSENPDDIESLNDLPEEQREMFALQKVMMMEQFRPMAWIILMTIPVFLWLYWKAAHPSLSEADRLLVMPFFGMVDLGQPIIGPLQTWIVWYVVVSVTSTQMIRKALDIGT